MHHHIQQIGSPIAFFLLGFLGSMHCLGMCLPLTIAAQQHSSSKKPTHFFLNYQMARLLGYTVITSMLFYFSAAVRLLLGNFSIAILAVIIILIANQHNVFFNKKITFVLNNFFNRIEKYLATMLGITTAIFPCGLLYTAYLSAILANSWLQALLWMLAFYGGTIPLYLSAQLGWSQLSRSIAPSWNKKIQLFSLGISLFLILIYLWMHATEHPH